MANDRTLGGIILLGSLAGIVIYFWLLFMSQWAWLTIQVSALLAVGMVLLIMAWIGYTLATTPPPMPLEDFDFEKVAGGDTKAIKDLGLARAKIKEVREHGEPDIGFVWFKEGPNGKLEKWKWCYDSSG